MENYLYAFVHCFERRIGLTLALITGFLGALTTFSSFSAEVVAMLGQGRYALALGTAALHLLGSLLLTIAGMRTVEYFLYKGMT